MIEVDTNSKILRFAEGFTKYGFDLLRNSLIVATLAYFRSKSDSHIIAVASFVSNGLLGMFIGCGLFRFNFKTSLFASDNREQTFGVALTVFAWIVSALIMSIIITVFVTEASKLQLK